MYESHRVELFLSFRSSLPVQSEGGRKDIEMERDGGNKEGGERHRVQEWVGQRNEEA